MYLEKAAKNISAKSSLLKYLNPKKNLQAPNSSRNIIKNKHSKSLDQIQLIHHRILRDDSEKKPNNRNAKKQQIEKKEKIQSSSFYQDIKTDKAQKHSKSLNKFLDLFESSNILEAHEKNQVEKNRSEKNPQQNSARRGYYNGFCYDLKINGAKGNKNSQKGIKNNSASKENINPALTDLKQYHQNVLATNHDRIKKDSGRNKNLTSQQQNQLIGKMKQVIEQQKKRQNQYKQIISELQQKIKNIQKNKIKDTENISLVQQKVQQYQQKVALMEECIKVKNKQIKNLNEKIKQNTKFFSHQEKRTGESLKCGKQCSKKYEIIIKSLKKVINEQLNKIIQLQRAVLEKQTNDQNDYGFDQRRNKIQQQEIRSSELSEDRDHLNEQSFDENLPKFSSRCEKQHNFSQTYNNKQINNYLQSAQQPFTSRKQGNCSQNQFPFKASYHKNQRQGIKNRVDFNYNYSDTKKSNEMIPLFKTLGEQSFQNQAIYQQVTQQSMESDLSQNKESLNDDTSKKNGQKINLTEEKSPNSPSVYFKKQTNNRIVQNNLQKYECSQNDSILEQVDEYLAKWRRN